MKKQEKTPQEQAVLDAAVKLIDMWDHVPRARPYLQEEELRTAVRKLAPRFECIQMAHSSGASLYKGRTPLATFDDWRMCEVAATALNKHFNYE